MDRRRSSPARLLAPIALVAFALALLVVIAASDTSDDSNGGNGGGPAQQQQNQEQTTDEETTTGENEPRVAGRTYTVKTGDTLAAISETVGVSVERLQELNPQLDPQALVSGQKIRIRE